MKTEINNLREEFMRLLVEKHDLLYNICPQLKAQHYEKFGFLGTETAIYSGQVMQLNRKLGPVQNKTNRGEPWIFSEVKKA